VTQSSVSRDIAELGLIKAGGIYRQPSRLSADRHDPDTERIREGVLMTEAAGANLIVIHTPPGEANRVAVAIDRLQWEEAVGTIAGDDTIFVAVHSAPAGKALIDRIQALTR
jgi:transcriptional regulator of arginine metabolism